ncbi:MAG: hypothetical protein J6C82_04250 [Clostridia bacterium]|nr:hypothetical protein [Clostridia bacterium]
MCAISCIANFKENLTKNLPYYRLLTEQINSTQISLKNCGSWIGEHAALCAPGSEKLITKICEGYQFVIAFSGELYDKEPLRHELDIPGYCFTYGCDAELALNSYIHFGEKSLSKLSGSFSFVIYDAMRRQIFAASDRFSSRPLFYSRTKDSFVLSSGINGILAHPEIDAKVSLAGLCELFSVSRNCSGNIFEDIFMLPPAHILKIKDSGLQLKCYACDKEEDSSENADAEKIVSKVIADMAGDSSTMLLLGGSRDEELCRLLCRHHLKSARQTTVYSFTAPPEGIYRLSANCRQFSLDESSVYTGLENAVLACGLPMLSDKDFLLSVMSRHVGNGSTDIFTALPDISEPNISYSDILVKNNAFFPAVEETLITGDIPSGTTPNWPLMIAQSTNMNLKTPIFDARMRGLVKNHAFGSAGIAFVPETARTALKHILLEIISENNSPILAFFNKSALLRLYEGSFDFNDSDLTEGELISYIIKLNIWLEKYRPSII